MATAFEEIQRRKKPARAECPIVLDTDVADAFDRAKQAYEVAKAAAEAPRAGQAARAALADAEEELEAAETAAREATMVFRFQALGREEYDALIDQHQPTPDQVAAARRKGNTVNWNDDTFPAALVAACLVEPDLTEDQVQAMWKSAEWNGAELGELFATAFGVSRQRRVVDLGKGSGRTSS